MGSRRKLPLLAAGVVALALLAAGLLYRSARGSSADAPRARDPSAALPVIWSRDTTWPRTLRSALRRRTLQLDELRGHPVVLNFFASWCDACNREAEVLSAGARRARARIVFLGADVNDYTPDARRFLGAHDIPFAAVRARSSMVRRFGLIGLPETFYLDRRGRVAFATRGELTAAQLARGLRRLDSR